MDWINTFMMIIGGSVGGAIFGALTMRFRLRQERDSTAEKSFGGSLKMVDEYLITIRKMVAEIEEMHLNTITIKGQLLEAQNQIIQRDEKISELKDMLLNLESELQHFKTLKHAEDRSE